MAIFDLSALTQQGLLPHGICLSWKPGLLMLHVLSDSLIAVAYFSIPFGLAHFVSRRKDLEYRWMFILFAGFIMACGTTHLLDIWTLWHPDYALQGIIKAITAIISIASAVLLWPVIGKALHLPSPKQLARINAELQREIRSRQETVMQLEQEAMERQRLEERLRQNEARLQAVLDTTVEGILSINAHGCIELANRAASQMFGAHIPEDGSARISSLIEAEEKNNLPTMPLILKGYGPTLRGIHADGSSFPIEVSVGVFGRGQDDEPLYTCVVRDMTERQRTEQLVREKETQLKQQENQLMMIQRQNTAGELAAMVSHEINQPLGAIANYLGGIALRYGDLLQQNPGLKDTVEETIRLAKRTSQIIQGIRNLIRRRPGDAIPVDIHALVEETLLLLHSQLARRQIRLTTHYDADLPQPVGDRIQIQQLLLNLILNAMDALETRASYDRLLDVELRSESQNALKIIIRDNGCGFESKETTRIFEPFYTTKESGIGLGLSICKSVAEAHNGIVSADSGPEGTRFIVELPCSPLEEGHHG
ncbi:MAG: two-component hybrid sensor and regulator [Pseudomonadota bacterium]